MTLTSANTNCLFRISQRIHVAHLLLERSHTFDIDKRDKRFLSIDSFYEARVLVRYTDWYAALRNFVSIRWESQFNSFCGEYNMRPAREQPLGLLEINSFHRETSPQKAIESYGWYASLIRNTRREHESQLLAGPRYCPSWMRSEMREREKMSTGGKERDGSLCAAHPHICTPVFTRDTSRESATFDKISPMRAAIVKRPTKG